MRLRTHGDTWPSAAPSVFEVRAGADTFVSGTALFGQRQLGTAVRKMREAVTKAAVKVSKSQSVPA